MGEITNNFANNVKDADISLQEVVYRRSITLEKCEQELLKPLSESAKEKGSSTFLYISAFVANLIAFACGTAFAWTSPVIPKLNGSVDSSDNPFGRSITPSEESWIAGLLCLGAALGPLVAGKTADKIGRKRTLLLLSVPILVSYIMTAFGKTVPIFYLARLFLGFGVGSVFAVLPMYLGEIAEDHNRGLIGCLLGVFIASGLLYVFILGPCLTIRNFSLACTVPLFIFLPLFTLLIPETPPYLASIGDEIALRKSLQKLRGKKRVEDELTELLEVSKESRESSSGFSDLFTVKATRKAFFICLGLILLQQFAGINAVLSYMHSIFNAAGGGGLSAEISTIIIGVVQVLTTILTSAIVEKLGRKILLVVSSAGSCLSLVALGVYFYMKAQKYNVDSISWLPVASLIVFIIAFNIALGPLPWAIMGELFKQDIKSLATTIIAISCFLASFLITLFFPVVVHVLGMAQSFWLFSLFCLVGTILIQLFVPETKGKTMREIQEILEGS